MELEGGDETVEAQDWEACCAEVARSAGIGVCHGEGSVEVPSSSAVLSGGRVRRTVDSLYTQYRG